MYRPLAALVAAPLLLTVPAVAQTVAPLETTKQQYSYAMGLGLASQIMQAGAHEDLDVDAFAQALKDAFTGTDPRLADEVMDKAVADIQKAVQARTEAAANALLAENAAFLEAKAQEDGITKTESGVLYRVETAGDGAIPTTADQVIVHYEGTLLNGTKFDSSFDRGEPVQFGVTQVIPGWTEVLQLMPAGSVWEVWIPAEMAYGSRGAGTDIGPNEVLRFKIQLLEVVDG